MTDQQVDEEYRVKYTLKGTHYHMRVFARTKFQDTWQKMGDLVTTEVGMESFVMCFKAEFIEE